MAVVKRKFLRVPISYFFSDLFLFCYCLSVIIYDSWNFSKNNGRGYTGAQTYGGQWKFLTYWNKVLL